MFTSMILLIWFAEDQKYHPDSSMSKKPGCSELMTLSNLDVARALQKYLPQNNLSKSGGFDHLKCQDCSVDFWLCSPLDRHLQRSPFCWKSEKCIFSGLASTHPPTNQRRMWSLSGNKRLIIEHSDDNDWYLEKMLLCISSWWERDTFANKSLRWCNQETGNKKEGNNETILKFCCWCRRYFFKKKMR